MAAAPAEREDFSYASLVNRWRRERSTTQLTRMEAHYYEAFDKHLRALHEDYQRETAIAPASPKALILLDELTNLQRVRDDLFDLREKKIVTAALIAARDGRPDRSNMTKEEDALFDTILQSLRDARASLLRKQHVPSPAPAPTPASSVPAAPSGGLPTSQPMMHAAGPPAPPEPAPLAPVGAAQPASMMAPSAPAAPEAPLVPVDAPHGRAVPAVEEVRAPEGGAAGPDERSATPPRVDQGRVLVRMKQAVEPFVAPDLRHYRLAAEDVAALPRDVAHVLVQRGLAAVLG